jgi:hypothetical protein
MIHRSVIWMRRPGYPLQGRHGIYQQDVIASRTTVTETLTVILHYKQPVIQPHQPAP